MPLSVPGLPGLPPDLAGPVAVALAKPVRGIPPEGALPGGCVYEPKWDGYRLVVVRDGASITEDEIKKHVKANLAGYKVPRDVEFIDELPRTSTGKVLKRELKEDDEDGDSDGDGKSNGKSDGKKKASSGGRKKAAEKG
jgi:acyl-CoA synthetase (AMP-forming)/AMP-acid ligase II